jgi:aspartate kinase
LTERGVVPVITGYIGATEEGITTTLGRGGSDYAAAIIGAGLEADQVWIWSDVDGILTADPNIVPQARTLSELSYGEAANLAYYGADVLHPKTVRPVAQSGIRLRCLNSFNPTHPGTTIVQSPSSERKPLPAIISTNGLSMIAVGGQEDSWTLRTAAQALRSLSEAGVEIPMFSQSFSEKSLNLIVRERDQAHCLRILCREFRNGACDLGVQEQVATISVVSMPGWQAPARGASGNIVSHTFAALGKHGTRVIAVAQAATEHSVSFCIPEDELANTVRFLHRELGLEDTHD